MHGTTIPELFFSAAATYQEGVAFSMRTDSWQEILYRDFSSSVTAIASDLVAAGLLPGARVAIIAENRPEWCAAYLGTVTAGGVAVPVDAQLGPAEVSTLLLDAGAHVVFHSSRTAAHLQAYREQHEATRPLRLVDFDGEEYRRILRTPRALSFPAVSPDDLASIIYTSGTTGKPKGVMLTHANFCSDARAVIDAGIVSHNDNLLAILPLHHTYAFMGTFLVPLLLGASITYPRSLKGPDMMAAIREREVTILIGVPQVLGMIRTGIVNRIQNQPRFIASAVLRLIRLSGFLRRLTSINLGRLLFPSVHRPFGPRFRYIASGGAKLDPQIMQDLEALGFTVLEGYGLTETSPVVTFNPLARRKPGSAGRPLPSVEIRIADPASSGEGEIEIRGPMVMKGYYRNPEATAAVLKDGWFRTGDLGLLDRDGYLFITGRSKEVIVMNTGKNIYPEEVEKLYAASRLIKEICVTGIGSGEITTALHGVIVPDFEYAKQAGIGNVQEALKWEINELSARMPAYLRITGYSVRKEPLPRTPLGKLRRFMIKPDASGMPGQERPAAAAEASAGDDISRQVLAVVRQFVTEKPAIGPDDHLELDLGLDSLAKIELTASLEKTLNVSLAEDFLADVQTVRDLIDKIRSGASGASAHELAVTNGWRKMLAADPAEPISLVDPGDPMLPSRIMHLLLRFLFRTFFRLETRGLENIPSQGSFIIASNHASYLDGFVVILALPFDLFRNIYSLGLSDYFTGKLKGWFARIGHVIPIDAAAYLNKALQTSAFVLRNGRALSVFPEGGRSFDNTILEFKKGVGVLGVELNVPVIPAYIDGAYDAFPRGAILPRPRKITITFGSPLLAADIDFTKKPEGIDRYQYFADTLRGKVSALRTTDSPRET